MIVGAADDVDGLLSTAGAELDGNGEELGAGRLSNGVTTLNTGEVDEAGLNKALLALGGPDDLVGESTDISCGIDVNRLSKLPVTGVGHGESGGSSTVLGLNDLVTTELNAYVLLASGESGLRIKTYGSQEHRAFLREC